MIPVLLIGSFPPLTAADCARSAHTITNEIVTHLKSSYRTNHC